MTEPAGEKRLPKSTGPFGEVRNEYCRRCNKPADGEWFAEIEAYEKEILEARA